MLKGEVRVFSIFPFFKYPFRGTVKALPPFFFENVVFCIQLEKYNGTAKCTIVIGIPF